LLDHYTPTRIRKGRKVRGAKVSSAKVESVKAKSAKVNSLRVRGAKVENAQARSAEVTRIKEGANVEVWRRRSWPVLSTKDIFF
jgi:hypothetical protein